MKHKSFRRQETGGLLVMERLGTPNPETAQAWNSACRAMGMVRRTRERQRVQRDRSSARKALDFINVDPTEEVYRI